MFLAFELNYSCQAGNPTSQECKRTQSIISPSIDSPHAAQIPGIARDLALWHKLLICY